MAAATPPCNIVSFSGHPDNRSHLGRNLRAMAFCTHNAAMKKTIHSQESEAVQRALVRMRTEAGLTHRQLAEKLNREHSFVWRIEHGERRLDLVEFFRVCRALGQDAAVVYGELVDEFGRLDRKGAKTGGK